MVDAAHSNFKCASRRVFSQKPILSNVESRGSQPATCSFEGISLFLVLKNHVSFIYALCKESYHRGLPVLLSEGMPS